MPTALLTASQYKQFQTNGAIPEFMVNGSQIPAFAMSSGNSNLFSSGKEWKLFAESISKTDLLYLYRRCDIAASAVDILAANVWGKGWKTKIHNAAGEEIKESPIEKQVTDLNKTLNVAAVFEEAHRYARALGLGIVVVGLADGKDLAEPVETAQTASYLTAFSSDDITNITFITDPQSIDYGKIQSYEVTVNGDAKTKFTVDASRVWHFTEKMIKKDPRGISVLEAPYDLFQILKNTDWAAGEAYYQNASPLYSLSWDDTDATVVDSEPTAAEKAQMKTDLEDLHVKKRFIKPKSWELQVVQGSGRIADPNMIWNSLIERIAGAIGIPKQLLLGTSAGALASGETNMEQWYGVIASKQQSIAEPLLNDFYTRLQTWGILPADVVISIEWPTLWEMDKKEEAEITQIKINSAVAATQSLGGQPLMSVEEAREQILGLNPAVGAGTKQNMQLQTNAPLVQANHQELTTKLNGLIQKVRDGDLTNEECLKQAAPIIDDFARKREADAIQYLANKTKQPIKKLPAEMMTALTKQRSIYLEDFKKILADTDEA